MKKTLIVHSIAIAAALIMMLLPIAVSYSRVTPSPDGASYEEVVTTSFVDLSLLKDLFVFPMIAFVATALLAVAVVLLCFYQHRWLYIVMTALSGVAVASVVAVLLCKGIECFTPSSAVIAYLLICSLVFSVQYLVGKFFHNQSNE